MSSNSLFRERLYQQDMASERADELFRGAHEMTFGPVLSIQKINLGPNSAKESMIYIRGENDGYVYTGKALRLSSEEVRPGTSRVQLSFLLGHEQPCESLDTKLSRYGFTDISKP